MLLATPGAQALAQRQAEPVKLEQTQLSPPPLLHVGVGGVPLAPAAPPEPLAGLGPFALEPPQAPAATSANRIATVAGRVRDHQSARFAVGDRLPIGTQLSSTDRGWSPRSLLAH